MNTQVYVMMTEMYPGEWHYRFTFHAATQEQANDKAYAWARYHGLNTREVIAAPATGDCANWPTNDDFVD